ncbi:Carboxylic ester hydrolase [Mycena venus]|uniref:Carboxylic ester hydrolase n=1 Tax=Mycena venus TaxID=2733690 RepID=A0A8H6YKE8_9AGAR|nr:Carboxylic ester hydrolase [Mycena venus]
MQFLHLLLYSLFAQVSEQSPVVVTTTSGQLHGTELNGVTSFKGVRFAEAPVLDFRWRPPVPFVSTGVHSATILGPACVQQFPFAMREITQFLYNSPAPASENEDCLFLNIWVPSKSKIGKKPVVVWFHGGGFSYGTASVPRFDGTSLAANQNIVVVTINYRTNIMGFPGSRDLPVTQNNLGFLDQELALRWVKQNIVQFGGDPKKVTIMVSRSLILWLSAQFVRAIK